MTPLPAFRIHLDDGTSYVTSMAANVTLEMATNYFKGNVLNVGLGPQDNPKTCVKVEKIA